ncbi:hypothetical protein SBDP1_640003 [Syntrophobacter sp. SbD1]|nr:hypothetical protein SBDP1_640003 [Syntrophobacter sp. SbD1]
MHISFGWKPKGVIGRPPEPKVLRPPVNTARSGGNALLTFLSAFLLSFTAAFGNLGSSCIPFRICVVLISG